MKKALLILLGLALCLGLAGGGVWMYAKGTLKSIEKEHANLGGIDLSTIHDGAYHGQAGSIPVFVSLEIIIKDHAIDHISIGKQRSGEGYQARETIDRIIQAQKPKVDAVSGATLSSRCIMVAAHRALAQANRE